MNDRLPLREQADIKRGSNFISKPLTRHLYFLVSELDVEHGSAAGRDGRARGDAGGPRRQAGAPRLGPDLVRPSVRQTPGTPFNTHISIIVMEMIIEGRFETLI